ncbi:dihydrodipicolinate synthase family protein [Streptomyces hokutonensis]|uniref:dihydrodipicolinate synthase family protein n=1 Tax=Streptomyces hokutonensis TaxID=1306990 RepID=UPI003804B650
MTNTTPPLSGIITPLVTPMDDDGFIDTVSLRRLVRFQLDSGITAVFPLGTTGEVSFLSDTQRELVVQTVVDEVAGRVPVLAGIVESSAARAIDAGQTAVRAGADYLVATGPYYGSLSDREVIRHFETIADALDRPVIAYDIPFKTHQKLALDVVLDLAANKTVHGLKDSSGDFWAFRTLTAKLRRTDFLLFTGSEPMVDAALLMGADGAVVGIANIDPAGFLAIYQAAVAGDWDSARTHQERIARLGDIMSVGFGHGLGTEASFIGGLKQALVHLGVIDSAVTAAAASYPQAAAAEVAQILEREGLLNRAGDAS